MRALVRAATDSGEEAVEATGQPPDAAVLSLCDFLAIGGDRIECLDEELRDLVAAEYQGIAGIVELPRAYPGADLTEWRRMLAACTLACAGMTTFLKAEFDSYFVTSFNELLEAHYKRPADLSVSWEECEEAMRRHIVTGGLTIGQRRELFDAHQASLRARFNK